MSDAPKKPLIFDLEDEADPSAAPLVDDILPQGAAMQLAAKVAAPRSRFATFALWAFSSLFTFVLTVAAWDFTASLMARSPILGWMSVFFLVCALIVALVLAGREWFAYARLMRLDLLRAEAVNAYETANIASARKITAHLVGLYTARAASAWGLARLKDRQDEIMDADALLTLAETELLAPLDNLARAEVESAARQVATVTALVPLALADVAMALTANIRMIRRIAEIYGGRSGALGSWKLLRRVFGSLVAAGALALTDDLIGSVAGGGILSKISRRFGEGVVNGALTARVGLAAIELCRPLPFVAVEKPSTSQTLSRALAGFIPKSKASDQ